MRYDENQERKDRLMNMATAVLGVGLGAKLLSTRGGGEIIAKNFGDISSTFSKISDDVSRLGRKNLDAENIGKLYNKHIKNADSTWNTAKNKQTFSINPKESGLFKDLNKMSNIEKFVSDINVKRRDTAIRDYSLEQLSKVIDKKKMSNEDFMKNLYSIVDDTTRRQSKYFDLNGGKHIINKKEFERAIDGTLVENEKDKIATVLIDALDNAEQIRNKISTVDEDTGREIVDVYKEHLKNKYASKVENNGQDRGATVNEILQAVKDKKIDNSQEVLEWAEEVQNLINNDSEIGELIADKFSYRMDTDNVIYSTQELRKFSKSAAEDFSETIAGKLFGVKNFIESNEAPSLLHFGRGAYDPGLASLQGGRSLLKEDLIMIGDKFYGIGEDGALNHFKEADGRTLISGRQGNLFGFMDRLAGNTSYKIQENKLLKTLDINTKGGDALENITSLVEKFTNRNKNEEIANWESNLTRRIAGYNIEGLNDLDNINDFYSDIKTLSISYNKNTKQVSKNTVLELKKVFDEDSNRILDIMLSENPIKSIVNEKPNFYNKDLNTLIKRVYNNPDIVSTMTRKSSGNSVIKFDEILQRELLKEALFVQSGKLRKGQSLAGYTNTLTKLEKANITEAELVKAKDIMNWGILQNQGEIFTTQLNNPKELNLKTKAYKNIISMMSSTAIKKHEDTYLKEFKESILEYGRNFSSPIDRIDINKNNINGYFREQWMTVKKTANPLDIIKAINDDTKDGNRTVNEIVRQLTAGRDDMHNVSHSTLLPFHLLNRLTTPLESIGLGFSNASTKSTLDLAKNIGLKRILPVAAAGFALSYLNYESENLTGTSLTESYENAKANFGVGIRTLATPLDPYLERQREFNPIAKYLFGDHKNKEEYLDYLEYGYDPVRKGRWWSFGSSSEFRGGKISYYEPNKLRQAHSNYRDIAIYGSSEEKWKHSLIPTLRHPFSTLRYLSNPYWLEEKHYDDRPYPVTGKMFSEGTPWGAILNPTIGEIIKPQKRMHKEHLQGSMVDVRMLIRQRNEEIKQESEENRLVRIDESGITPMSFSPTSMPSMSESVYTIKVDGGKITSHGFEGQDNAETYNNLETAKAANLSTGGSPISDSHLASYGLRKSGDSFSAGMLSLVSKFSTSGAIEGSSTLNLIKAMNNNIKRTAENSAEGAWIEKANNHTLSFRQESIKKKLSHQEDMIEMNTRKDFVHDLIYSGKQLSGMYGFLWDQMLPSSHGYKLQQAGKMTSFSRRFWDQSVGGLGGNLMEIARRFFPHDDHNITQLNPIMNTMPDWLPERFQTGDPFVKLPNGEARLPGAGFEALNKLHPDKYGNYGSFDRYKILADIAPLSEEYKIWKKIAKQEVSHPFLKKEMAAIDSRVKEQIKEHDFYNYKFIGKKMKHLNATISEVSNTGKFKITGSEQEFSIAGLKTLKDQEGNSLVHNHLNAGMNVVLKFEDNEYNNKDAEGRISAIVLAEGRNLNEEMWKKNAAKKKETMETLADQTFMLSDFNFITGHLWEAIGHAPIPFIHNKFMRINSPLESYRKEQIYGTPYSTWDHPIKGFIKPAFQEAIASSAIHQAIGVGTWFASEYFKNTDNKTMKTISNTAFAFTSPGAFAGGMIGAIPKMSIKDEGIWNARNGARIGTAVTLAGYALTNTQNPWLSMLNFGALGVAAQQQLKFKGINNYKAGAIGAAVGLGLSGLNSETDFKDIFKPDKWIPKDAKKKWEIEEYFDRLEYTKYMQLYEKAATQAKFKEGVSVRRIVNQYERNKKKNEKVIKKLEQERLLADNMIDENAANELRAAIDQQIYDLMTPIQYLGAGEYTKAALSYKKAADTTIYGLSKDATTADVLRALPKYDRDFFLEFANENDPKEREKILKYISPYKKKALKIMWGEDYKEVKSNSSFFSGHALPGLFWSGWKPNVDLEHVKMKTIENEGMLLSDFGLYDSAKNEPAYQSAPEIKEMNTSENILGIQSKLTGILNGLGFIGTNVTVEPTRSGGIQVISNIMRETSYSINSVVQNTLGTLL